MWVTLCVSRFSRCSLPHNSNLSQLRSVSNIAWCMHTFSKSAFLCCKGFLGNSQSSIPSIIQTLEPIKKFLGHGLATCSWLWQCSESAHRLTVVLTRVLILIIKLPSKGGYTSYWYGIGCKWTYMHPAGDATASFTVAIVLLQPTQYKFLPMTKAGTRAL